MKLPDRRLVSGIYLIMLAYAASVTMIGPLMPELIRDYGLRISQGGLIMTFQSVGGIAAIVLGGLLSDKVSKGHLIAGAFFAYAVSLFLVAAAPNYGVLLGMFLLLGASTRLVDTVNNAYTADLHPDSHEKALNLLHTFFGLGALTGPLLTRLLLSRGTHWATAYAVLGVLCLGILVFFVTNLRREPSGLSSRPGAEDAASHVPLRSHRMWLLCAVMILYVGHQSGLVTWLPMYLETHVGAAPYESSLALSLLWVGIILGRFSCSRITQWIPSETIIPWGGLVGGFSMLAALAFGRAEAVMIGVFIAGLFTGAIIPLLVNIACLWFPKNTGTVSSMIFLSGTAAMMTLPWLLGFAAEHLGFGAAMPFTGVTLLVVFVLGLFIRKQQIGG